jgi:two-component system, chemotaxis family, sensor kinase CheA
MAEGPLKYFRVEAHELVDALTRGLLDLEQGGGSEAIDQCFRSSHTLKGAARIVRHGRIAEIAHAIEDALAPYRESGEPLPGEYVGELLRLTEAIRGDLELLEVKQTDAGFGEDGALPARRAADEDRFETVRVAIADMDALLDGIAEAVIQIGALRSGAVALAEAQRAAGLCAALLTEDRASAHGVWRADSVVETLLPTFEDLRTRLSQAEQEITAGLGHIEREMRQEQARARELRLVPAGVAMDALELAARDTAEALGKRVTFTSSGGEIRLEGHILAVLREALLHVVQNAVDHGIEEPVERTLAGKPEAGKVRIRVERRGGRVAFICQDDGRGVDLAALRRAATRSGLHSTESADGLSRDDALGLMFHPGLSTRDAVTEISGRGVGLDVVRATASKLKGQVSVRSELGKGTTIEILVPVSLTALSALTVTGGGLTALLPTDAVTRVVRLSDRDICRGERGDFIVVDGKPIPLALLSALLGAPASAARIPRGAVVVSGEGSAVALGVDRLLGTSDVVIKPLPHAAGLTPLFAGATFDKSGDPLLVLDPEGLLAVVRTARVARVPDHREAPRPPILVIDDSLTTRMLEQSILESAGYEVDLAASAEEGLARAEERRYGLFIVDVEMPGMSGFEFAERARDDPSLSRVPVMMVTSFTANDARSRGARAGVKAFIVKGEFDQREFIGKVAELVATGEEPSP